jgi:hypothetical protein
VIRFEPSDAAVAPLAPSPSPSPPLPSSVGRAEPPGPPECKANADCVVEPEDCCDCNHGGRLVAMVKTKALSKAQRAKKCKGMMCAAVISNDPSCAKKAACAEGRCVLK